jgi:hypothetical protein
LVQVLAERRCVQFTQRRHRRPGEAAPRKAGQFVEREAARDPPEEDQDPAAVQQIGLALAHLPA